MGTTGSMPAEDQEGSKCCYKSIEVLLQKDWKDRRAVAKVMKGSKFFYKGLRRWKFATEDWSVAAKDQEDRSVAAKDQEDRSAIAKDQEDLSVITKDQSTTKDPKIEVLLRRIERLKRCCKRIKWSCDAEDGDIEE